MIEKIETNKDIDSNRESLNEIERQFVASHPQAFESLKDDLELQVIEQIYLSHPDEPFNLRLRETITSDGTSYTATLKDRGTLTTEGLSRREIETPISQQAYTYYKSSGAYPFLRKLRAEPEPGVVVDWCEGLSAPIIEIEASANQDYYEQNRHLLIDRTGSPEVSSEQLAHNLSPNMLPGTPEAITPQEILARIMALRREGTDSIVVGISGRSGSGKTTIAKSLLELAGHYLTTARISTDDYHRGKTWLENTYGQPWTNWDAPEVYDTKQLNFDLFQLSQGVSINSYAFDLATEEPVITGRIEPSELIIVEGIYAGSSDLRDTRHLHVAVPTPLATSVGRRIVRDMNHLNDSFASPQAILRYQLEVAEPTYRAQK